MALPLYDPSGTQLTDRQQANAADPNAFGASVGRSMQVAGDTLQRAGGSFLDIAAREKAKDDTTAVISADAEATARLRKGLYGDQGIFTRTGVNADGMTLSTEELVDNIGGDVKKKLTDPAQIAAFDKMWGRRKESTLDGAATNEFKQRQATRTATKTAALENITADVVANYNNPAAISTNLDATRAIIRANPDGLPQELVAQMERESVSAMQVAVIQRMAQDDPGAALDYYEKNKAQVAGPDHARATSIISSVKTARTAKAAADEIANTGSSGSLAEAMFHAESGGEEKPGEALSDAGAMGDAQLMPKTAREVALSLPGMGPLAAMTDEELQAHFATPQGRKDNRRIGTTYLQTQLTKYKGDVEAALIAYNAGPKNADKFLDSGRDYSALPKPEETLPYVKRVLGRYQGIEISGETSVEIQRALKGEAPQAYYKGDAGEFLKTVLQPQHGADHIDAMNPAMRDRLAALFSSAPPEVREGLDILSGARTHERQKQLWEASDKTGKRVARPGNSKHEDRGEGGEAADLGWKGGKFASAPENVREWVHANAAAYGLRFPMSYEPWHIETVEARKGGTPKGKASKPNAADVASAKGRFGPEGETKVLVRNDDGSGMVVVAPPPSGSAADIYTKSVAPFSVDPTAPDADDWLKTARERYADNPSLLAEVERQLGDEATLRKNASDQEIKALQAQAVREILNGNAVRDMDPLVLQKLGAEGKLTPLLEAESKWTKEPDDTDEATYIRLSKMSPQELVDYDLMQDANKLSKADLKKFADQAATFQRDPTTTKRATDQTRSSLMTQAENMLGLDPAKSDTDAKSLYKLNKALDGQIAVYMANNKKEPDGDAMRKMIDDLIMEGHVEGALYDGPSKPVFEMTPAEISDATFFAGSVKELPQEALPVITRGFRNIYKMSPDEEGAVSFYNDMLRIQAGGAPPPPEALDARIRQAVTQKRGRPATAEEIAAFYREWVVRATAEPDG